MFVAVCFIACQNNSTSENEKLTEEEKTESVLVDTMKKTDEQRADSFLKAMQQKMEKSKLGK